MSRITDSAAGERCTILLPGVCNGNPATTVWCHSNKLTHGKGVGKKSHEIFGAYGCSACHDVYDRRKPRPKGMTLTEVHEYFQIGHDNSLTILIRKGLVTCK